MVDIAREFEFVGPKFFVMGRSGNTVSLKRDTVDQIKAGKQKEIGSYFKKPRIEDYPRSETSNPPTEVIEIAEEDQPVDPFEGLVQRFPYGNLSQKNLEIVQDNVRQLIELAHQKINAQIEKYNSKKNKTKKIKTDVNLRRKDQCIPQNKEKLSSNSSINYLEI